jgi:hypothetical protein
MKCNYQSWRSQHDGIPFPSLAAAAAAATRLQPPLQLAALPILPEPPWRSSSTLAHNLYYGCEVRI